MPYCEHVYEQDFECYRTGFVRNGKDPALEIHLRELKRCAVSLGKSDDGVHERTAPSTKLAVQVGRDKRSEPRFVTNDSALLQILNPFSATCWHVRVLNVSKHGLGLCMPTGVVPGADVKVRTKDYLAFGNARYSVLTTEGFLVGIQLHDHIPCRTVPGRLRPEDIPGGRQPV
jgi:hypothetical protein